MIRATLLFLLVHPVFAQYNCHAFLMEGDSCKYKACIFVENAPDYFQLRREFHEIYDSALVICPDYHPAFIAKSVAYLKTGDWVTWKELIDKAVALKPEDHLAYRGWCKFQFARDYRGALKDFKELERLKGPLIDYSQNGDYHLKSVRALCFKMRGKSNKAIKTFENQLAKDPSSAGLYSNLHLGVLYLKKKKYAKALIQFEKQTAQNELAENYYYMALTYKHLSLKEQALAYMALAKVKYEEGKVMFDPYTHQVDKVYLSQIEKLIADSER